MATYMAPVPAVTPARTVTPTELRTACLGLQDAIGDYEALRDGIHWDAVYPGLDSPEPDWEARQIAAQTVRDEAGELRRLLGVLLGDAPDQGETFWADVATAGLGRAA